MRKFIITLLVLITISNTYSQNQEESYISLKIDSLYKLARKKRKSDIKTYNDLVDTIFVYSEKSNYKKGIAQSLILKTNSLIHDGDYNNAEKIIANFFELPQNLEKIYINEMLYYKSLILFFKKKYIEAEQNLQNDFSDNLKQDFYAGFAYSLLGAINTRNKQLKKAINNYKKAIIIYENTNKYIYIPNVFSEVALLYMKLNMPDLALDYSNKSIDKKFFALKDDQSIAILKSNAALIQVKLKKFEKADTLLNQASNYFDAQKSRLYYINNNNRIANLAYYKNQYNKCISLSNKIIDLNLNEESINIAKYNLGLCYFELKQYNKAIKNLIETEKYLTHTNKIVFEINEEELYSKLTNSYLKIKDTLNYFRYKNSYLAIQNENYKSEKENDLIKLQLEFDKYIDNSEIEKLKIKNQKNELKVKTRNIILLIGVIFTIIIFVYTLILKNISNKKEKLNSSYKNSIVKLELTKNELTKTLNEKNILIKEVHHRVKNNLQLITSLLNLQANKKYNISVEEFVSKSQSRIEAMALVHENLYKNQNLEFISLDVYVNQLINNLKKIYTNKLSKIKFHISIQNTSINIDTAITIGLIVNELILNSCKYAFINSSGNIHIEFKKYKNDLFILKIKDDGKGYDVKNQSNSFGLQLVNLLSLQLKATLEITSSNMGTINQLILKL
ncbi:tetratricopeptide repeat-containing sensor histidine kinase [Tenacibaculum sp. ZS6-P6]|uniref:tetratricopeptide repeat-containing sensor histidine kinase n=1 Tax=Tenacibaculum sp. ZS6-P6 TaxID=3447503 RepID=UPI003F98CFD6